MDDWYLLAHSSLLKTHKALHPDELLPALFKDVGMPISKETRRNLVNNGVKLPTRNKIPDLDDAGGLRRCF